MKILPFKLLCLMGVYNYSPRTHTQKESERKRERERERERERQFYEWRVVEAYNKAVVIEIVSFNPVKST